MATRSKKSPDTAYHVTIVFCAKRFFHPWHKKIRYPFVRPSVLREIIDVCELNLGGGTHAAGPWCFELWRLEGRERTLHLFGLATVIGRSRNPFLNTVSETFLQDVSKNTINTLQITPGTAPFESFQRCDVIWRRSPTGHTSF